MLTGEVRNQIDRIWDAFWSGGISNPMEVIEQMTRVKKTGGAVAAGKAAFQRVEVPSYQLPDSGM